MGHHIYVDDEVFERIQQEAEPFVDTTPNAVLRKKYGLPAEPRQANPPSAEASPSRVRKGALMPLLEAGALEAGQRVHWHRRNQRQEHVATVMDSGELRLEDGRRYRTPSAAAVSITGYQINGWNVWETDEGVPLADLR
ncbi:MULTISPECIES: restriction system modified-DNA reader domain-containing protein [Streptomyces]|uniref:restriction system modified-DNA reader domain-containing protein n=1 Tax=Streptomyces TaxID=1883 RepID=UPI001E3B65C5|nr:hypothetical protein [Streptomyces sp. 8ZJF_21]MCC4321497.1 hypothetical protein [Streptomyces malaysiensis]MCD9593964.1 hypothetical protein [Streptomyces sp. 8ZJF_21]